MNAGPSCMENNPPTSAAPSASTAIVVKAPAAPAPAEGGVSSWRAALNCLAAAIASGLALFLCYHPVAWGFLGWVALAPMLVLVRTQVRPALVYGIAFLGGLCFFTPALSWMRVAHSSMAGAWLALSLYCALYVPLAIALIRFLDRRAVPLVLSAPLVWVALEYVRCHFLSGFSWYLLAHTQHDFLPIIQITDLGGVFVVSFVVAAVNGLVCDLAYQFPEVRQWFLLTELPAYRHYASLEAFNRGPFRDFHFRRNVLLEGAALGLVVVGVLAYGFVCLSHDRFTEGPTVCLLQSNIDQRLREGIGGESDPQKVQQTVLEHFSALCVRATRNHIPRPDLIIWPETSYPTGWIDVSSELPVEQVPTAWRDGALDIRQRLKDLGAKHTQVPHLLGMNSYCLERDGKYRHYNSALLLSEKGTIDAKFDKIHRVPFGEYIPLKDWLPFLAKLSPYEGDFGVHPGEKFTRFALKKYHFGVLICYEDTDPFLARRYLEPSSDGPPVDFLVNISNDGWFDGSSEHEEHLAVSRFRAIECRRAMVRSVNMGVSAVIDSNGRVLKPSLYPGTNPPVWVVEPVNLRVPELPTSDWSKFKKTALVMKASIPIDNRFSLYPVVGDVVPLVSWAILVATAAWGIFRRRKAALAA